MPALPPARDPVAHAPAYAERLGWPIALGHRYRPRGGCTCRDTNANAPCDAPGAHPPSGWAAEHNADRLERLFASAPGAGVIAPATMFDAVVLSRGVGLAAMTALDRRGPVPCLVHGERVILLVAPGTGEVMTRHAVEVRSGAAQWVALPPSYGVRWDTPPWDEASGAAVPLMLGQEVQPEVAAAARLVGPPAWLPTQGVRRVPCGRWFDAVRAPRHVGDRALHYLDHLSGPVIEETDFLYWLVPPGTADGWRLVGVRVLGAGHMLTVPRAHVIDEPTLRWRVPVHQTTGDGLTNPGLLHAALGRGVVAQLRGLPEAHKTPREDQW